MAVRLGNPGPQQVCDPSELRDSDPCPQPRGGQLQALVDEALADLIEKRKLNTPRAKVMAAYLASH
jgi:hypothetical protein